MVYRKFHGVLRLKITEEQLESMILRLIKFYNGGISEDSLLDSPLTKIIRYSKEAVKIAEEMKPKGLK